MIEPTAQEREAAAIREAIMSTAATRQSAESVVTAILEGLVDLPEDDPVPTHVLDLREVDYLPGDMTVGDLRTRLRLTLTELALRDAE